jgi:transmembrane sensor
MNKEELKGLPFVLRHYSPGMFDTRKAIHRYKEAHPAKGRAWVRYVSGIAASVAICLLTAYYFTWEKETPVCLYSYADTTVFTLPDSSVVTLFPNSTLSYLLDRFNKDERAVDMTGKISFDVRRNQDAPFIVTGKHARVEVLGTRFEVSEVCGDTVEVYVSSGKVLFSAKNNEDGVVLTKGMRAVLPVGSDAPQLVAEETVCSYVSTSGKFVYENTPLSDVLKELSEYFRVKLTCVSTGKTLTAEFDTANLDEIILLIEKSLNVKIRKESGK